MKTVWIRITLLLALLGCLGGCDRERDFELTITNHDSHEIAAVVNGNTVAIIAANSWRNVQISVRMDNNSPTSSYNTQFANVSFHAQRTDTGELSRTKQVRIETHKVNPIEVNPWDFPYYY